MIAQRAYGDAYAQGRGVEADPARAMAWYRAAATSGDVEAQLALALHYANGLGAEVDLVEAARWLERAAERGDGLGQIHLGIGYFRGQGVTRDLVAAHTWFVLSDAGGSERWREVAESALSSDELAESLRRVAEWREAHRLRSG